MYDIFISYSSNDKKQVSRLVDALVSMRGWSVWWDEHVQTGSRFTREIEQALNDSRCVLVVWSANSVGSDWVRAEADDGRKRGLLAPIRLDESPLPIPFGQTETTDFSSWHGTQNAPQLLELIEAIQRILSAGSAPGTDELLAREKRQRALRRRRQLRYLTYSITMVVILVSGVFGFINYQGKQVAITKANQLAREADDIREKLLTDTRALKKSWWWLLFDEGGMDRFDQIETSILLAIEAMRIEPTPEAERSLRNGLAIMPFSNWSLTTDEGWKNGSSLDFSHDGRLLALGGSHRGTIIWNYRDGEVLARIEHARVPKDGWKDKFGGNHYKRGSRVIDFSPIENLVATAGLDGAVKIWDSSGNEQHQLQHEDIVYVVQFSPDGQSLASASQDGTAKLWATGSGAELARLEHSDVVNWVEFSPTGKYVATTSRAGRARVWNAETGEELAQFEFSGKVSGVRFGPHEKMLVTFGNDFKTSIWDWQKGELMWEVPAYSSSYAGVVFNQGGDRMVVGGTDGLLSWWDIKRKEPLFSEQAGQYILRLISSPDGRRIATLDTNDIAQVWDIDTGRELKRMPYAKWSTSIAISPDGKLLASGGEEFGREYNYILEVTNFWPEDSIGAACDQLRLNLTRNQWRTYMGDQPYRLTCPEIEERKQQ